MSIRFVAVAACALALLFVSGSFAKPARLAAYSGTGTWVSIYDHAAWANPEAVIEQLQEQHIGHALPADLERPAQRSRSLVLGAITIDPVGARYWLDYPFRRLARQVDVFLPMAYFTARTRGPRNVGAYSRANIEQVRRLAGSTAFPVHPIGGETRRATLAELRAFLRASDSAGAVGVSFWEYGQTAPAQWELLARRPLISPSRSS